MKKHCSNLRSFVKLFPELKEFKAKKEDLKLLSLLMKDIGDRLPAGDGRNYAGLTYLGQFIVHDVTFEKSSNLNRKKDLFEKLNQIENMLFSSQNITEEMKNQFQQEINIIKEKINKEESVIDPSELVNSRTSLLDLDSVYGEFNEFLNREGMFDIGTNDAGEEDLPRDSQGIAIISDPRNDENRLTSGIHLAFLKFHNKIMMDLKSKIPKKFCLKKLIKKTRTIVKNHYHFIVIDEFLRETTGPNFDKLVNPETQELNIHPEIEKLGPKLPLEFVGACFRFGHSLVRDGYYINEEFDFFPIFDPKIPDLRGFKKLPNNQSIDWSMFFPMPYTKGFQEWEGIDPFVVKNLFTLPQVVSDQEENLPFATLKRSLIYGLPSGQDLARKIGIPEENILTAQKGNLIFHSLSGSATEDEIKLLNEQFGEHTPLFFYILQEAWTFCGGESLGPLGSQIVGGVILNLLKCNTGSCVNNDFNPKEGEYGCVEDGRYYMTELLTYAFDLRKFNKDTLIPDLHTNFFDQHSVDQFSVSLTNPHKLQKTIQPDLIPEKPVEPFLDYHIGQFDPTIILEPFKQEEIDKVASNAVKNQIPSVYAVFKFIYNKNIQAIAKEELEPFAKKIPEPVILSSNNFRKVDGEKKEITKAQLRGRALNRALHESVRFTKSEAEEKLQQVEAEIEMALNGVPPYINIYDSLDGKLSLIHI